eukprot:CAMPEP_0167794384 /NCGR_PEP_ID=MMETSP0111_2-20121227/13774_1 /TAXON_ID=91324 /ORGANISM="Lotharella globosa, Strain CCCM811" /LENGTH=366 /DNA_ID=CAMNT_0007687783 /DNA_START=26 /DNA_END=1126 /DNA_ORIENTATION=+
MSAPEPKRAKAETKEEEEDKLNDELLVAAQSGNVKEVSRLLEAKADVAFQESQQGISALMAAAVGGHSEAVNELLCAGAPWNAVDKSGRCAGDYALRVGHQAVVDRIVSAGVAAELLFAQMDKNKRKTQGLGSRDRVQKDSKEYIDRNVRYQEGKLLDSADDAVMMEWETPLMEAHAGVLCPKEGLDVLNIGFGMGIVDTALQKRKPKSHTIVEAHGGVLEKMRKEGWDKKKGVIVVPGRWQDVMHELGQYDAVFFDTYGEYYEDMREFHSWLPTILKKGGIYSFFNGFCPDNIIFQGVMCQVVQLELAQLKIQAEFAECDIAIPEKDWKGVKRRYFWSNTYYLPICRRMDTEEDDSKNNDPDKSA